MQIQSNPAAHAASARAQSAKAQQRAKSGKENFDGKLGQAKQAQQASKNAAAKEGQKSAGKPDLSGSEMAQLKQKLAAKGAKV